MYMIKIYRMHGSSIKSLYLHKMYKKFEFEKGSTDRNKK